MFMDSKTQYFQDISSSQLDNRFNAIPIKIPTIYFVDINKLILKFIQRGKILTIANTLIKQKNKVRGLTLPDFKTYCKATVIKTQCGIGKGIDKQINGTGYRVQR